jgi:CheY-like chemotaxis protein
MRPPSTTTGANGAAVRRRKQGNIGGTGQRHPEPVVGTHYWKEEAIKVERNLLVAVIDDNRDQCQTLAEILEEFHCEVTCCWEPRDAISLCRGHRFDLIVLDIKMPRVSGIEILVSLERDRHGCIVIATGLQDEALRRECLAAGADDVMLKPLDIPHLLELAEAVRKNGDCQVEGKPSVTA